MKPKTPSYFWPAPKNGIPLGSELRNFTRVLNFNTSLLEKKPKDFDPALGINFLINENVEALKGLDEQIQKYNIARKIVREIVKTEFKETIRDTERLIEISDGLSALGYKNVRPSELDEYSEKIDKTKTGLHSLISTAQNVSGYFTFFENSIRDITNIIQLERLLNKIPRNFIECFTSELLRKNIELQLKNAFDTFTGLSNKMSNHSETFVLKYLPDSAGILEISKKLHSFEGAFLPFLSHEYRLIRKKTKKFLVNPKSFNLPDIVKQLDEISETLKQVDVFNEDENFKKSFGEVFSGIKTDWSTLKEYIKFAKILRSRIGSLNDTKTAMADFKKFTEKIFEAGSELKRVFPTIAQLCYKLKAPLKSHSKPENIIIRLNKTSNLFTAVLDLNSIQNELKGIRFEEIALAVQRHREALCLQDEIGSNSLLSKILGEYFRGIETKTKNLICMADWVVILLSENAFPEDIFSWLFTSEIDSHIECLKDLIKKSIEHKNNREAFIEHLAKFGELDSAKYFGGENNSFASLGSIKEKIDACKEYVPLVGKISDLNDQREILDSLGLGEMMTAFEKNSVSPKSYATYYEFFVFDAISKEIIRTHPRLKSFTRSGHEETIENFAKTDTALRECIRLRSARAISQRKDNAPIGCGSGRVGSFTELSLINHELTKQKRHIPIRQLVRRAPKSLQALKPCFMMSPMSVAQYLVPNEIKFDLLIMDEASQIKPEDALGAIARAKQMVIVGDPKQLPPTNFFQRVAPNLNGDDGTAIVAAESILDICMTHFKKRRLRWHYRSEHESLIAFSNHWFYDSDLVIFPSSTQKSDIHGVTYQFIPNATYVKQKNKKEASVIASAIMEHFQTRSHLSLGVATFNIQQKDLIMDEVERLQKANPWFERKITKAENDTEPFFVKNLENVQGDERDVIFISTTYGPDPISGKPFQRFGPLNGDSGWRRLNVIITRAKKQIKVFTSMKASDIIISDTSALGVRAFKYYLEYAEKGILIDPGKDTGKGPDSYS